MNASASYPPDVVRTTLWIIRELTQLKDQRFVDGVRIRSLVDQLGLPEIEQKIYFLRELHAVIRRLPLKIFHADDDRLRLIAGVQEALDAAIDEEEEEFE